MSEYVRPEEPWGWRTVKKTEKKSNINVLAQLFAALFADFRRIWLDDLL